MTLPAGVVSAVGPGKSTPDLRVLNPDFQFGRSSMLSAAKAGTSLKNGTSQLTCDIATSSTTDLYGILGDYVIDPSTYTDPVLAQNIPWLNYIKWAQVGTPVTVWKRGEFALYNVHGLFNAFDFVAPYNGGLWQSTSTTNTLVNGFMRVISPNAVSNVGPIVVLLNVC